MSKKGQEIDDDEDQFVWNAFVVDVIIIIIITIRHNNKQLSMIVRKQREKKQILVFCLCFGYRIEGGAMSCRDVRCLSDDKKIYILVFSSSFHLILESIYLPPLMSLFIIIDFFLPHLFLVDVITPSTKTYIQNTRQGQFH
jgi:hypothetical protein